MINKQSLSLTNNQHSSKIIKTAYLFVTTFLLIAAVLLASPNKIMAQTISLSISPPLLEVVIQPDKEIKQIYTITNNGSDTLLKAKVVYFIPSDTDGNVETTEVAAPDWVKYSKDVFNLKAGEQKNFNLIINPPSDTPETDHFLTLIFETTAEQNNITTNNTFYKTEIGSNILITISKDGNPHKSAQITTFETPKIIDSHFGKLNYQIILSNDGNSFWKANGKIIIDDQKSLKIAPLNILSGYSREISCLDNDELINCIFDPDFKIGIINSKLEFRLDEDAKVYSTEATTISFPFVLIFVVLMLLTLTKSKIIFKAWRKRN